MQGILIKKVKEVMNITFIRLLHGNNYQYSLQKEQKCWKWKIKGHQQHLLIKNLALMIKRNKKLYDYPFKYSVTFIINIITVKDWKLGRSGKFIEPGKSCGLNN